MRRMVGHNARWIGSAVVFAVVASTAAGWAMLRWGDQSGQGSGAQEVALPEPKEFCRRFDAILAEARTSARQVLLICDEFDGGSTQRVGGMRRHYSDGVPAVRRELWEAPRWRQVLDDRFVVGEMRYTKTWCRSQLPQVLRPPVQVRGGEALLRYLAGDSDSFGEQLRWVPDLYVVNAHGQLIDFEMSYQEGCQDEVVTRLQESADRADWFYEAIQKSRQLEGSARAFSLIESLAFLPLQAVAMGHGDTIREAYELDPKSLAELSENWDQAVRYARMGPLVLESGWQWCGAANPFRFAVLQVCLRGFALATLAMW